VSIGWLTVLLFIALLIVFAAGGPVALGLGGLAMLFASFTWGPQAFKLIPTTILNGISDFVLLALPLFIFMGQILVHSGVGARMFHSVHVITGRLRGGLAIGVIVVCSMIGAMVGIIGAGILTAGTVALLPMLERGYNRYLALGTVMAGGGLGILIPPSIPMIVFSSMTKTSIGQMFAGAIVPAAIMVVLFIAYIVTACFLRPSLGPALPAEERSASGAKLRALRDAVAAFGLIFTVLGSILAGVATPTEAGALGCVGALILAALYGSATWDLLKRASIEAMRLTAVCVWILIGATILSNFHMLMGGGGLVASLTRELGLSPWGVILSMQLIMLALGCVIDEFVIVVICAPLFTPIAVSLGFDPIWFGVLMILNMEIAIQTPPYGFALFYLRGIAPEGVGMTDIYRSITPFVAIKFAVLGLCMAFPSLVTWLPEQLFR
jgi:tripartite ATP-independent transporter DctM subunit